jgi:hypothetical protein
MLVTAQQLQQLQQQNQHIQIQHYQPVPIQAVAGTPLVRPLVLKQQSLPAFPTQSLPQTAQGPIMVSTMPPIMSSPVVAANRVSLSIDNPRQQVIRPPGSVVMAPAALASPRLVQVPMAGIARPIFIGRRKHGHAGRQHNRVPFALCLYFFTHLCSYVYRLNSRWTCKYHKGPTEGKDSA